MLFWYNTWEDQTEAAAWSPISQHQIKHSNNSCRGESAKRLHQTPRQREPNRTPVLRSRDIRGNQTHELGDYGLPILSGHSTPLAETRQVVNTPTPSVAGLSALQRVKRVIITSSAITITSCERTLTVVQHTTHRTPWQQSGLARLADNVHVHTAPHTSTLHAAHNFPVVVRTRTTYLVLSDFLVERSCDGVNGDVVVCRPHPP